MVIAGILYEPYQRGMGGLEEVANTLAIRFRNQTQPQ